MESETTAEGCPRRLGGGRYTLGAMLGRGGSGIVYRAEGPTGPCAVKLRAVPEAPLQAARFLVESVPMSRVRHPRVVGVLETGRDRLGESAEFYWIAMDLCESGTVADLVRREGPLPVDRALELCEHALEGLQAVHEAGFVHRDVKPQNLFLDAEGGVVVGDFGVARHLEGGLWFRTGTGQALGTMGYRAPEQDVNAKVAGPPADVYGVAATLWFMVLGRRPPLLYAARVKPELLAPLPPALRDLVRDATVEDPAARIPTALAFRERVRAARVEVRRAEGLPPLDDGGVWGRLRGWLGAGST